MDCWSVIVVETFTRLLRSHMWRVNVRASMHMLMKVRVCMNVTMTIINVKVTANVRASMYVFMQVSASMNVKVTANVNVKV